VIPGPALLFCPADRPDRYAKALERADGVILDLEDAVLPSERAAAREAVAASRLDPERTIVRINPVGTPDHELDLAALAGTAYRTVMLAKAETLEAATALRDSGRDVVVLCETALGVENAGELARDRSVVALMWGAEDLVVSLGGRSSRRDGGGYRDVARFARSRVLIAAAAHGIPAIDAVHLDIADVDGLAAEARDAAAVGFTATACIHPSQVAVVRDAYRPSDELIAWSRRVLDAAEARAGDSGTGAGVFELDRRMVDGPVLHQARRTLSFLRSSGGATPDLPGE